jgi:PTS hybrid protein
MTSRAEIGNRVSLVLVSHSAPVANAVADLVAQVAGDRVRIVPVGGAADGTLGTDWARVAAILHHASTEADDAVVVVMDFGSAVLNVRAALAQFETDRQARIVPVDAPLVEGALAAAMAAAQGLPVEAVADAARGARTVLKF